MTTPSASSAPKPDPTAASTTASCTISLRHASSPSSASSRLTPGRAIALSAASLAIPFAFDRLIIDVPRFLYTPAFSAWFPWATLCLIILVIGFALFVKRAWRNPMWWFTGAATACCIGWMFAHNASLAYLWVNGTALTANFWYAAITGYTVLPALLMLFLQLSGTAYHPRHPAGLMANWTMGWTVSLFTHWSLLVETCSRCIDMAVSDDTGPKQGNHTIVRKIGIALLISLPMFCLLIPLLMQADEVFSYGVTHLFDHIDFTQLLVHTAAVLIPAPFLFSLLASVETRTREPELHALREAETRKAFDPIITTTVLGLVLALYAVFCAVQFTFLFAGAGLPDGYTYASYARQGFFQLLFVATLNLAGFGLVLTFAPRTKPLLTLQIGLVAATGVMLVSATTRLGLYINTYGMTWLRWLSLTFILLLALVLTLALVRLFRERLPLLTISFVLLLVWWLGLGMTNPDWVIATWNARLGA
ncbi:DUF4153 domain-containing protein [Bifidobacterium olomucense]|uniref:DUF4173 domain-containing protein n=1 Tax=Bifidobacterium olomucense TaxID=2675324 RepID=A0A7Y0HX58_9BIFI|nr:DUF4173 domain-containing protein [Bifidobacterium sp. DSM 109959]NMM97624.1 hypothetical protein [Bifidobacterium sp. DSM 109959]